MSAKHADERLEFFCDAVFAIALTLLIIDIRIPPSARIETSADLWRAFAHLGPSIFAFVLSFVVIFITWVNHYTTWQLVERSSYRFVYANGLLLLSVVFIPFPTALLGETLPTGHATPAVVLYSAVCAFQAVGWNLMTRVALKPERLTRDESSRLLMLERHRYSYFAFVLYSACAVVALWIPKTIAVFIGATWVIWLIVGLRTNRG